MGGFCIIANPKSDYLYKGNVSNNQCSGVGSEQNRFGHYIGESAKGMKQGLGLLTKQDSSFYLGYWLNDQKNRYGLEHGKDGDKFEGEFSMGDKQGLGRFFEAREETTYTGSFENDKRSGFGRLECSEYIFVGGWERGEKSGLGYQSVTQGGSYFGYWKHGMRHGVGFEQGKDYDYKGE